MSSEGAGWVGGSRGGGRYYVGLVAAGHSEGGNVTQLPLNARKGLMS